MSRSHIRCALLRCAGKTLHVSLAQSIASSLVTSSRPPGRLQKRPDDRRWNAGVAVRTADGSRRTADAGDEQCLRCGCSSPSCTVVLCAADIAQYVVETALVLFFLFLCATEISSARTIYNSLDPSLPMVFSRFYRAMLCIRGTSHGPVSVCVSVCHKSQFY